MTVIMEETRPLLHDLHDQRTYDTGCQSHRTNRAVKISLPVAQLTVLCLLRLADPIAFTQIFPYVNEMMERFGVATDPSQTGFYSGLVESVFALAQLVSIYYWANLSDHVGRRPIILLGTCGIAATTFFLGFTKTLAGIILARALAGLFSGNVAVMHSALGELTNQSNQALAYPIYGLCWPLGVIIGPLLGGALSNPVEKYPRLFKDTPFVRYPYLLPCSTVAGTILLTVLIGTYRLKETLPHKLRTEKEYSITYGLSEHADRIDGAEHRSTAFQLFRQPLMRSLCASGCALSFVGTTFDVVFVLFCYSPIETGGLSFSVTQIGYALAIAGISSAAIQIIVMPPLLRRFSCARLYKFCMWLWPLTFIAFPFLGAVAKVGVDDTGVVNDQNRVILWIGIGVCLAISRIGCLAFSLNMILVKEFAPGSSSLGTANGLAQFSQCLARTVAPTFSSCLFAFSINNKILSGNLWVVLLFAISFLSGLHSMVIPEVEGKVEQSNFPPMECVSA